jgi:hypothetical protein
MIRRISLLAVLLVFALSVQVRAQGAASAPPTARWSASVASAFSGAGTAAVAFERVVDIGALSGLTLGYVVRASALHASDGQRFTTARASLIGEKKVDTLLIGTSLAALNAGIIAAYRVAPRVTVGFSLDLVGASVGQTSDGISRARNAALNGPVRASPTSGNVFLAGRADRGTLNSEFAITWWAGEGRALRGGFNHFVAEVTTATALADGNARFRRSLTLPFVAVVWGL